MKPLALLMPLLLLQLQFSLNVVHSEPISETDAVENSGLGLPRLVPPPQRIALRVLQNRLDDFVFGKPLGITNTALALICNTVIDLGIVQRRIIPDLSGLNFVLQTDACNNISVPLSRADELWNTPGFLKDRPTTIFITGWRSTINNTYSGPVAKAYACRNDTNFLLLDTANYIDTLYTWSAINTEEIGRFVAEALLKLDRDYVTSRIHVMGHSLGAQIAGATGRNFRNLTDGEQLTRVTGLDPANPCFYDGNPLSGVRSGDAKYVDIIITNPGVAGTADAVGDGNFFVEGLDPIKSGCTGLTSIYCSHQRAVDYLAESVYPSNTENFQGRPCTDYKDLENGRRCSRLDRAIMGYAATESGLFYVDVNSDEPYGKQASPRRFTFANSTCGACAADST